MLDVKSVGPVFVRARDDARLRQRVLARRVAKHARTRIDQLDVGIFKHPPRQCRVVVDSVDVDVVEVVVRITGWRKDARVGMFDDHFQL